MDREKQIRTRAHQLWESEGRPEGREAEHWARATEELDSRSIDAGVEQPLTDSDVSTDPQPDGSEAVASPAADFGIGGSALGSGREVAE
jgi:hypothetical protein